MEERPLYGNLFEYEEFIAEDEDASNFEDVTLKVNIGPYEVGSKFAKAVFYPKLSQCHFHVEENGGGPVLVTRLGLYVENFVVLPVREDVTAEEDDQMDRTLLQDLDDETKIAKNCTVWVTEIDPLDDGDVRITKRLPGHPEIAVEETVVANGPAMVRSIADVVEGDNHNWNKKHWDDPLIRFTVFEQALNLFLRSPYAKAEDGSPAFQRVYGDTDTIFLARIRPSMCPGCRRVHDYENSILRVKPLTGEVYYLCRRGSVVAAQIGTVDVAAIKASVAVKRSGGTEDDGSGENEAKRQRLE